ncbi:MAG: hypothetical protein Q8909_21075, partial [Bacteroidota bacterium]|nr:hypothetical protein [Bacteroidota bacterium]
MRNILKLLVLIPLLVACSDYFEPAIENNRSIDAMYQEPAFAQGLLGSAYILLPYQNAPATDLASDDAVTNDFNNAVVIDNIAKSLGYDSLEEIPHYDTINDFLRKLDVSELEK